jgi:hypothetical protein
MAEQTSGTNEKLEDQEKNQESTPEINSWAAAFEAIERASKGDSENPADTGTGNDMA